MATSSTSGQGRPKGVPNRATSEIKALAQSFGPAAIMRLAELAGFAVGEDGEKLKPAESEAAQIAATKELLDRGYGKAAQPQTGEGGEGPVVTQVTYRWASTSDSEE